MRSTRPGALTLVTLLLVGLAGPAAGADGPAEPAGFIEEPRLTPARFEDAVGDRPDGAGPDLVAVSVSQPESPLVSFSVEFASVPPLGYDLATGSTDMLMIAIATRTGAKLPDEVEYVIGVHGANLTEVAQTGGMLYEAGTAGGPLGYVVDVAVDGPLVTMTVDRHLIGDPDVLSFRLDAVSEGPEETGETDTLPDGPAAAVRLRPE